MENRNNKFINGYALLLTVIATGIIGCSVPKHTFSFKQPSLPDQYSPAGGTDTANITNKSWQQFFPDPELVALIDTAIRNNTDLQRALQKVAAARAQVQINKGAMLPSLDVVVSGSFDKYGKYTMNGVGNFDTNLSPNIDKNQRIPGGLTPDLFAGLRSSWEADIWGKLKTKKKAAYLRYLASEKGRQWAVTQLVAQVAALYYELLALDNEQRIIEKNILLQQDAVEVVKAQKEGGRATELAVQQFNAQLYNTESTLFSVKQLITQTENALNVLTGKFPQMIKRSSSLADKPLPLETQAGLPLQLLTRRPDIQQAEFELAAAGVETEAMRKAFLPSLHITPYTAFNAFSASLLFSPGSIVYGVAGGLTAPVFNRHSLKSNHAIASAEQADAFARYRQTLLNAYQEVVTNLKGIEHYKEAYRFKTRETAALQAAVNTAHELYVSGYASYLEVITAQKGVLEAELGSVGSKRSVFGSWINLYRSLGGGWASIGN